MVVYQGSDGFKELKASLLKENVSKILCVCGRSCQKLPILNKVLDMGFEIVFFDDFSPNPDISSAVAGIRVYRKQGCDGILAVGGGSAMDIAKCIKLYIHADLERPLIGQVQEDTGVTLAAIPTTAGTGSEATRFSVVYYQGDKQSVTHDSIIPDYVLLEPSVLRELPDYQRKVTAFDALSHAIESYWSVNSTDESKEYSREAIRLILDNYKGYLCNDEEGNANMLRAANMAGRAINITQTTAGHAMSYKLTSLYGLSHGHAVAICLIPLWKFMEDKVFHSLPAEDAVEKSGEEGADEAGADFCVDRRGMAYLKETFAGLRKMICVGQFEEMVRAAGITSIGYGGEETEKAIERLAGSVNATRLKNNPVRLSTQDLQQLYRSVFEWK